ncbi:MAG TPA: hypothetical protein VFR32_06045 [Gaiellaceae bacterium]|nr:hypothetical protein [Gaiellaceae bacterium]
MSWARWAPLSGIAFATLWVAGFVLAIASGGDGESAAEILADYADAANRDRSVLAFLLTLLGLLFFVWFLALLRGRLAAAEGRAGTYTAVAFGAGLVASVIWVVAAVFQMAVDYTINETKEFVLDPNTERLVSETAYLLFVVGTPVAGLVVLATSLLGLRAGAVPRWLAWLGLPLAALMILAFLAVIPLLLFLAWVVAVSLVLFWQPPEAAPMAA